MKGDYYTSGYTRVSDVPRRNISLWILDAVMTVLSLATGLATLLVYLVPYIHPARIWFLPVMGLTAPALFLLTLVMALYWVIRWRLRRSAFMLAVVLVGLFSVSLYWRPELRRDYGESVQTRGTFKVMTYNVRNFYGDDGHSSVDDVVRLIRDEEPDVVCLQEFNARLADRSEEFRLLGEDYEMARFGRSADPDSSYGSTMLIMSKYRIVESGVVLTPYSSVWADLKVGDQTLRVISNHLRSTAINAADNDYITSHRFLTDTAREVKIRSIVERYRNNSVLRAAQVDSIAQFIEASPELRLVCGDFNDTPNSYVYRKMARGLQDAFSECGSGYSHTFRGFYNMLRIDFVLPSEQFEVVTYRVPEEPISDHYPVVVQLKTRVTNN